MGLFGKMLADKCIARNEVIGFLFAWAVLTGINLFWGIDVSYRQWFEANSSLDFLVRVSELNFFKDPFYFLIQAIFSGLINFELFFAGLIFLCLAFKFSALLQVNRSPTILDVLPYFLVLGFLHEGIQMRIAIALSIAIWSIILYAKNQRFLALFILALASTFHISASTFFAVFFLLFAFERWGRISIFIWIAIAVVLAYTPFIPTLLIEVGRLTNARFLLYSEGVVFENQNSTGLFQYFILFVIFLTGFIWRYYKPISSVWSNLYRMALASGFLAIAILQIFRFNVVVSSRLADLLLLPVLLVLGATLTQLKNEREYFPLFVMSLALIFYCAARAFISFNPVLFRTF